MVGFLIFIGIYASVFFGFLLVAFIIQAMRYLVDGILLYSIFKFIDRKFFDQKFLK